MLQFISLFLARFYASYRYLAKSPAMDETQVSLFQHIVHQEATEDEMALSLSNLMEMMQQYYHKPVILLIDEYDVPIQQAWENNYYTGCIGFMRQFLGSALKTNTSLDFAVLTGVLRISKESIFSGLNNISVCSVADPIYEDVMGFTRTEVAQMAQDRQMEEKLPEIQSWYDGYHFGKTDIYNPWSVINFFSRKEVGDYWVNTSGNGIIQHMLCHLTPEWENTLLVLLKGETITAAIREGVIYDDIDKDEDALYSLLLTTGYLTIKNKRRGIGGLICELTLPNREIKDVFRAEILERLKAGLSISRLEQMLNYLVTGQTAAFSDGLSTYIRYLVSLYDSANKESFYHGFLLGMTALLVPEYVVESNRESGYGRFDLAIFPKDTHKSGVILEFKVAARKAELKKKAQEALQQINSRGYLTEFEKRGIRKVWKYGITFYKKEIYIVSGTK